MYRAFTAAQEAGHIPLDEIWDAHLSLEAQFDNDGNLRVDQPYHISRPAIDLLHRLRRRGRITEWRSAMRVAAESNGASAAYAWAYLPDESLVLGHARVRASFFPAFPDYDLADDLSHLDLADRLQRYLEGDQSVTVTQDYVAARVLRQLVERHGPIRPSDLPDWSFGFSG